MENAPALPVRFFGIFKVSSRKPGKIEALILRPVFSIGCEKRRIPLGGVIETAGEL
jgi:hypothetical protein